MPSRSRISPRANRSRSHAPTSRSASPALKSHNQCWFCEHPARFCCKTAHHLQRLLDRQPLPMARNLNPEEATPMLGLIHYSSRSAPLYGLVLLFLTLVLTHILPAQSRMTRKATHHTEPASRSVVAQTVPEPPLLASFSHRES